MLNINPFRKKFPLYYQLDSVDCGPTCLRMISAFYGKKFSLEHLRSLAHFNKTGVSLLGIIQAAEAIGFRTLAGQTIFEKLKGIDSPFIVHWNYDHFIVVYKIRKDFIYTADPTAGYIKYNKEEFLKYWATEDKILDQDSGVILALEPTEKFYNQSPKTTQTEHVQGLHHIFGYLLDHKALVIQLLVSLLAISLLQLAAPFMTQVLVDVGIGNNNLSFINLILLGQLFLFGGRAGIDFTRRWSMIYLSSSINISLISDFLKKLMRLPLTFFDSKMTGDILKRIEDHNRVERFLSSSTLNVFFSTFSILVLGSVLLIYDLSIFIIFLTLSLLYVAYLLLFLKKRAQLDYKRYTQLANNQNTLIEAINGMTEIKLNNSQRKTNRNWEYIQAQLFGLNLDSNKLSQFQESGGTLINELKNILITYVAATAVINGDITLGMMLSIQFIIGQLNVPINDIINIIRDWQDAKLSLERIGEIKNLKEEDSEAIDYIQLVDIEDLTIRNLSFQYEDENSPWVLKDVNITIPKGKITAIVGMSGSGKTTLLKLLLKYFSPTKGDIQLGDILLEHTNTQSWRNKCGVVMQDNYIFSDTILNNITLSDDKPDIDKFYKAIQIAHIEDFVKDLPMGYSTKIGQDGVGISGGQKQRILIARAVYKNPQLIILDEATSALDANNEKIIVQKLNKFFKGKTVVIVAHRLSTVRNSDQIVVLDEGRVTEIGNHKELVDKRGKYFELIKNQLEL